MLAYTITEGEKIYTDESVVKYTYSITSTFGACENCETIETFTNTYETYSTFSQSSNGNWTLSAVTKYKDNGPKKCPEYVCKNGEIERTIGGYARCNGYSLTHYTINFSDGKRTEYRNNLTDYSLCDTVVEEGYPKIFNIPYSTDEYPIQTTSVTKYKLNVLTTTATEIETTKLTTYNENVIGITYYSYKGTVNTHTLKEVEQTIIHTKKTKRTLGYKYQTNSETAINLSQDNNFRNTIVYITNSNILWYKVSNPKKEGEILNLTNIFKSTKGIKNSVTLKYSAPELQSVFIGSYNCSSIDEQYGDEAKKKCGTKCIEKKSSTISYISTTMTAKTATIPAYSQQIPFQTATWYEPVSSTFSSTVNTKNNYIIKAYHTTSSSDYLVNKYTIKASNLSWNILRPGNAYTFSQSFQPITSTHGKCVNTVDSATFIDYIQIKKTKKLNWGLSPNNGGAFEFHSPVYIDGMVSPKNLSSYVKEVKLAGGKQFRHIGGYAASVLPNIVLPINNTALYSPGEIIPNGTFNCLISSSAMSAIQISSSYKEDNFTLISTTEYSWEPNGKNNTTFFLNTNMGRINNPSENAPYIGDPNIFYKMNNYNIGRYRNDGDLNNPITRVLYPGRYFKIGNQLDTYAANNIEYKNINNDEERDLFIPIYDEFIANSTVDFSYFEEKLLTPEVLSQALQDGFN